MPKTCSKCGKTSEQLLNSCPFCGEAYVEPYTTSEDFNTDNPYINPANFSQPVHDPYTYSQSTILNKTLICNKCGTQLKIGVLFCGNCGTLISMKEKVDASYETMLSDPFVSELIEDERVIYHHPAIITFTTSTWGDTYLNRYISDVIVSESFLIMYNESGILIPYKLADIVIKGTDIRVKRGKKKNNYYKVGLGYKQKRDLFESYPQVLFQIIIAKSTKLGYVKKQYKQREQRWSAVLALEREIEKIRKSLDNVNRLKERHEARQQKKIEKRERKRMKKLNS